MNKPRERRWNLGHSILLGVLALAVSVALWRWGGPLWAFFRDRERIQAQVTRLGPWGPLLAVALNVGQVLLAPIPGQFVGLANGYLYGVWLGTLYSMIGLLIGTALAMALGRWFGRPLVVRLVPQKQLTRWDAITADRGPLFFFLVFLLPFVPDDITSFLIGLSPLAIPRMLVMVTLGRLPGVLVSSWVGAYATTLPWWAWPPMIGGAIVLAWGFLRYQEQLEAAMVRLIDRLTASETDQPNDASAASPGD